MIYLQTESKKMIQMPLERAIFKSLLIKPSQDLNYNYQKNIWMLNGLPVKYKPNNRYGSLHTYILLCFQAIAKCFNPPYKRKILTIKSKIIEVQQKVNTKSQWIQRKLLEREVTLPKSAQSLQKKANYEQKILSSSKKNLEKLKITQKTQESSLEKQIFKHQQIINYLEEKLLKFHQDASHLKDENIPIILDNFLIFKNNSSRVLLFTEVVKILNYQKLCVKILTQQCKAIRFTYHAQIQLIEKKINQKKDLTARNSHQIQKIINSPLNKKSLKTTYHPLKHRGIKKQLLAEFNAVSDKN